MEPGPDTCASCTPTVETPIGSQLKLFQTRRLRTRGAKLHTASPTPGPVVVAVTQSSDSPVARSAPPNGMGRWSQDNLC